MLNIFQNNIGNFIVLNHEMVVGDFGNKFNLLIFLSLDYVRNWLKGQDSVCVIVRKYLCILGEVKSGICSHSPSPSKK